MSTSRSHEYIPPQVILTIGELGEVYETRTPEKWADMTVREVMEAYPQYGEDIVLFLFCSYINSYKPHNYGNHQHNPRYNL